MNGSVYLAEACSNPKTADSKGFQPSIPEDLGKEASHLLLEEICRVSQQLVGPICQQVIVVTPVSK